MKSIAYALALVPALIVTPALAQSPAPAAKPAAPPPAAPAAKPVAPTPKPAAAPPAAKPAPATAAAPTAAAPAAAAAAPPATVAPATPAPTSAAPVAPVEPGAASAAATAPTAQTTPAAPVESVPAEPAAAPAPVPTPAPAEAPAAVPEAPVAEPSSLELFGTIAPTVVHGEPANPQLTNSFRRVGVFGEVGVAYRSKYFLDPYASFGYATLASGETTIPDSKYGAGGTLHQHLGTWILSPGVTSDIWRFRLRFGIGLAIVKQSFRFQGDDNTATQLSMVWEAGLGYNFYKAHRFRLDAEARFVEAKGSDVSFWMLGITGRGDVATF